MKYKQRSLKMYEKALLHRFLCQIYQTMQMSNILLKSKAQFGFKKKIKGTEQM